MDRINQWLTLLANIGVLVGVFIVAYELRQNTSALELSSYQQLIERIADFNLSTLEYPELRAVRAKVEAGEPLSDDEADILNAFLYLTYRNGDLAFMQYERGTINEERLHSGVGVLTFYLKYPLVQAHWARARESFVPSYAAYVDGLIADLNSSTKR